MKRATKLELAMKRAVTVLILAACVSVTPGCGQSEPPEMTEDISAEIQEEDQSVQDAESEL